MPSEQTNPMQCGCKIRGSYEHERICGLRIEYCLLHEAAPDLLKALEAFMGMWGSPEGRSASRRAQQNRADMWDLANAAVAKARPAKEKRGAEEKETKP